MKVAPKKLKPRNSNSVRTVNNETSYEKSEKLSNFRLSSDLVNEKIQHYPVTEEACEGQTRLKTHLFHERNTRIVKLKKEKILAETGCLKCEVCNFDFFEVYGERGTGFIECHHLIPLSDTNKSQKTKLSDLSLLCSNCHRMIHNKSPLLTISELKDRILKNSKFREKFRLGLIKMESLQTQQSTRHGLSNKSSYHSTCLRE